MKNSPWFAGLNSLSLLGAFLPSLAFGTPLTLEQYLDQVKGQSPAVQSSVSLIEGSQSTSKEKDLPFIPKFFVNTAHTIDHREYPAAFLYSRTVSDNFNLGFEKLFDFGLNAKLSYTLFNNDSTGVSQFVYPNGVNIYTSGQTQLDLSQSLWRNFFGKESRAGEEIAEATSLASHYGEKFKLKQTLSQAENAYNRLAIANESVRLETELLDRAQKILDWTTKRVNNHLTDKIDLLQARASHQARKISLEAALNEQKSGKLAFNQFRDRSSNEVDEQVTLPSTDSILSLTVPKKAEVTDDIKAAEQSERITKASNELSIQKAEPDLSLFGTAAFNGVDRYLSPALGRSFSTQNPYYVFGIKFSFPIYFWETSEIRGGRVKQQLAAEATTRQKMLENNQTWSDLTQKLTEAQGRLKMANDLVNLQKDKLEYEKYRFNLGRTTTYQVLVFEQDYAQSLISRLRVEQEILGLHSQIKTYAQE